MELTLAEGFAERLRVERAKARMSQEECARRAEVNRTQISVLESGKRLPRLETLLKLAGALEVEPGVLIGPARWRPGIHEYGSFDFGEEGT
jgi:transcriptional regulator with XRE-family HTH domain